MRQERPNIASLRWHYPDQVRGYVSPGIGAGTPSVDSHHRDVQTDYSGYVGRHAVIQQRSLTRTMACASANYA